MQSPLSLSEDELSIFLFQQVVGVLATVDPNCRPHAAPVWLLFRGHDLFIETGHSSRKAVNLRSTPACALVAGLEPWGPSVMLRGTGEEVVDEALCKDVRQTMATRFYGSTAHPSFRHMEEQFENYEGAGVFRLLVTSATSWDYSKMPEDEWILPWAPPRRNDA